MKTFRLLGPAGFYASTEPGTLGGNAKTRIYGRLDCRAPRVGLEKGTYQRNRVFFSDAVTAEAAGYRPCGRCMRDSYRADASGPSERSRQRSNSRWGRNR